jgi:hypothetical protein
MGIEDIKLTAKQRKMILDSMESSELFERVQELKNKRGFGSVGRRTKEMKLKYGGMVKKKKKTKKTKKKK